MKNSQIIEEIEEKYHLLGEDSATYLKGLLHAKPVNYWDYIEVDTLLSLQRPRTSYKDEKIFIMYHQVTELVLGMILHEIEQLTSNLFNEKVWLDKISRLNRYTNLLITSFDIMKSGMNYEDYNIFRSTLTPASGFQSAQFRFIEIHCTRLLNLISVDNRKRISDDATIASLFDLIYWKEAGINRQNNKKSLTLTQFEERYLKQFIQLAEEMKGKTLEEIILRSNCSEELINKLKEFDRLFNVSWPKTHLQTAEHYLSSIQKVKKATGGSPWKKYLDPKSQKRIFFPSLWSRKELDTWGQ